MQLTPHFNLREFARSSTAMRYNIDNTIPEEYIPNIQHLCTQVLEPLRQHVGEKVFISSGYRCAALNKQVGGATNSQHLTGEACDIWVSTPEGTTDIKKTREWFTWIMDNCRFDTLILERSCQGSSHYWIHVSCKRDDALNRQRVRHLTKSN